MELEFKPLTMTGMEQPVGYNIEVLNDVKVKLIDHMGDDAAICQAARVSTIGTESIGTEESVGLINFLMKNRHGSPFEHGAMKFVVEAPIFVAREQMRHRIGFSYNEESGRYRELKPKFYIPHETRPIVQVGKPGAYTFEPGDYALHVVMQDCMMEAYQYSWDQYKRMLDSGIAKEVARMVLPVGIFTSWYMTLNPRSMMHYLSLRSHDPAAAYESFPMFEIERVARSMEVSFQKLFPITYAAFNKHGRVSP